ncbi:MAG TPA: energy-dependent translational throttle protein EttA [Planctomycetes bacterium]|nr:energy-dependent translational throttle protein EttA [Planctomycetota bacterium]
MSEKFIFQLQDIHKRYGDHEVLKGITLAFFDGAKIGVIGPNGAGKTTLLRIIAGEDDEFEGSRKLADGKTVGYVSQEPPLNEDLDVWGNIQEAVADKKAILDRYNELCIQLGELEGEELEKANNEFEKLQAEIDAGDLWELDRHLERAMHALDVPPKDADVKKLSGGEKRRVALCRTLIRHPDLLLLDEPTNHLDADAVAWLEHHLAEYQGTVILITHDRYFLDNVVGWMLEIDRGKAIPYKGNYSSYLEQSADRLNLEKRRDAARRKVLERELAWIRQTPKARQAKSKARIREFQRMMEEHREVKLADEGVEIPIPPGPRLGNQVISFEHVSKAYGDRVLIDDLSFDLPPGGIVGVIGPNGAGKTTLMKMITGEVTPDSGTIRIGKTVQVCYVDQGREALDDSKTVFEEVTGGAEDIPFGDTRISSRAYVGRFRFRGGDQQKRIGELSGGQRNRAQLAKLLRHGGNVLLLDEPTNDLDLNTLRVLEEAVQQFPGCAVVVSHDRYFLNRTATHILAFEGDGHVHFFEGDYDTYLQWKKNRREELGLGEESKKAKYRKL